MLLGFFIAIEATGEGLERCHFWMVTLDFFLYDWSESFSRYGMETRNTIFGDT